MTKFKLIRVSAAAALLLISACTKDNQKSPVSALVEKATITGSVFASSVSGASVSAKTAGGEIVAGPISSFSDGTFSLDIPTSALSSDITVETNNGTFIDEATAGQTTAGVMAAFLKAGNLQSGSVVNITPTSTIVHGLVVKYGLTPENAASFFASSFGFTNNLAVTPKNTPLTAGDADTLARLAYIRAAAFSQLTKDLGLAPAKQFDLLAALSKDLADGVLDGQGDSGAVMVNAVLLDDIQSKFAAALATVQKDTIINKTCMNPAQIGAMPFAKTAATNTYRIEYGGDMIGPVEGKTAFKLKVTRKSDGSPATGLVLTLMPKMYMATMSHSAPVDAVSEDGAHPGTYNCAVYYLMASGPGMGYWELKVMIGNGMSGESAIFYPPVSMAMGSTTVRATLKGQNDNIPGMMGPGKRTYYLFNESGTSLTPGLEGTWKEIGCSMGFGINGQTFIEYNSVPPAGEKTFAGDIINNPDRSAEGGILIIRITDVGTSENLGAAVGKYTAVRWKGLSAGSVGQTNARDASYNAVFYATEAEARALTVDSPELNRFCCEVSKRMGITGIPGNYSLNLYVSAGESMMSFPGVSAGTTLHDATGSAWTVNTVTLSASTDNTAWVDATSLTGGHWTVSGLTGLTTGVTDTIYFKLTINGEQKTTDGMAPSATNGMAAFTVTP